MINKKTFPLIMLALVSTASQSEILKVCVKNKSGEMRISEKCKKSEHLLTLNTAGPTEDNSAQVFDSNGQFLGVLIDGSPGIYIKSVNASMFLTPQFGKGMPLKDIPDYIDPTKKTFYTTDNCTGTQYYIYGSYFLPTIVKKDGKTVIAVAKPPEDVIIKSFIINGASQEVCNTYGDTPSNYQPPSFTQGVDITDITLPFTLPIAYPLHFK